MKIHTRRNAAVGYLTIRALQRELHKRRRPRRSGLKVAAYIGLGLISAGLLAAALAIALRRRSIDEQASASAEGETEIIGEYVTAPEPVPAA
jgi:hypothetical protein